MPEYKAYVIEQDYGRYPWRYIIYHVRKDGTEVSVDEVDNFETIEEAANHARRGFQDIEVVLPK